MQEIVVFPIDHSDRDAAAQIHAVRRAAYLQEAALLGAVIFPPLNQTAADIQHIAEQFYAAWIDDVLVGAASVDLSASPGRSSLSSITVLPQFQRRGIASALLSTILQLDRSAEISVTTGSRNGPALSLYNAFGFRAFSYRTVGPENLELVELKRLRHHTPGEA